MFLGSVFRIPENQIFSEKSTPFEREACFQGSRGSTFGPNRRQNGEKTQALKQKGFGVGSAGPDVVLKYGDEAGSRFWQWVLGPSTFIRINLLNFCEPSTSQPGRPSQGGAAGYY